MYIQNKVDVYLSLLFKTIIPKKKKKKKSLYIICLFFLGSDDGEII